jgi:hypothetical protein
VEPTNELLDQWSVKYYLVDSWFEVDEDLSEFEQVGSVGKVETVGGSGNLASESRWQILARLNALPRLRFEDGSGDGIEIITENPSRIDLKVTNSSHEYLVMADRYDQNWRVFVNGKEAELENFNEMRRVKLVSGENLIIFSYCPKMFMVGLVISSLNILGTTVWLIKKKI